jgi:hypothetical protein
MVIACLALLMPAACKLEPSSATPNQTANANQAISTTAETTQEKKSNCPLTKTVAPVLNGLTLGMTADDILALFPGSKDDEEVRSFLVRPLTRFGASDLIIRPQKFESKEKFSNINMITFTFLDARVHRLRVAYNGPEYSHVDQFVTKFVQGTSLPPADQWEPYVGMDTQLKTLTCKDFEVQVFAGGQGGNLNYVSLTDLEAEKKLKDRRAKVMANASTSPTP